MLIKLPTIIIIIHYHYSFIMTTRVRGRSTYSKA
jgi:hypothetical protein